MKNIKSVILGMVFLFGMSATADATSGRFSFEQCDGYASVVGAMNGLTYEQEFAVFEACMSIPAED